MSGCSIDRDDLRALLDERFRNEHEADEDDVDSIIRLIEPVAGVSLTPEEAALAAEALYIGQESLDDYADQFSDVDARLDEGKTRTAAAGMRALAERLEATR